MLHFPSTLQATNHSSLPRKSDGLNATQQKAASHQIFLTIEEELHDARRVHSHGQEEDLRLALNMVINRVGELSSLLSEAYKLQAELEVQLNVAKSNLQLVISNNEMLEEALKRDSSGHSRDVGWRRSGVRESEHREQRISEERPPAVDGASPSDVAISNTTATNSVASSPPPPNGTSSPLFGSRTPPILQDNRFFKFRFASASTATSRGKTPTSRPETPSGSQSPNPSLSNDAHQNSAWPSPAYANKELEELNAELERERAARQNVVKEKAALEAELEALSQALFEEANKMVATERIKRAETEEELKELRQEKDALRGALRLVESENKHLRGANTSRSVSVHSSSPSHSRTSSRIGLKSPPASTTHSRSPSLNSAQLSASRPSESSSIVAETLTAPSQPSESPEEGESESISRSPIPDPPPLSDAVEEQEVSPWADVPATIPPHPIQSEPSRSDSLFSTAAIRTMR